MVGYDLKVVVFLGPPGAGKGTQAGFLSGRLGFEHVSTGALLRHEISAHTVLGLKIKSIVEAGGLVNDDVLFECLENSLTRLLRSETSYLLLDGVPRTLSQVERLDVVLKAHSLKVDIAVAVAAPVELLVERFGKRWTCKKCGNVEAFPSTDKAENAVCRKCSSAASFLRREDDSPEAVRNRFTVYESETAPLIGVYRSRELLVEVNGLRAPEWVYVDVASSVLRI